jgi:hypothetical protein
MLYALAQHLQRALYPALASLILFRAGDPSG